MENKSYYQIESKSHRIFTKQLTDGIVFVVQL